MARKDRPKGGRGQRILQGANLALYTLIGIAIVVLVNWFVNRHDKRWDLTPDHEYSLSPQSKKILKNLKQNVTIYAFDRKGAFSQRRDLLGEYADASHRVKVRYVDPDRQPALAKQFGVQNYGTIEVVSGTRHFQAQSTNEEGVTNALIRVLMGEKTIYFMQGHGERNVNGTGQDGFQNFKSELNNESYKVKTLMLFQKNEIPADCEVLVVAGPKHDYLPPEIATIQKYIENGGRALFMLDAGVKLPNLDKLLDGWGVGVRDDLVVDLNPVARLFGTTPDMPLIIKYGSNPIVQPMQNVATLFPLSRSIDVSKGAKGNASPEMLCETSGDSFGVENFNPSMHQVSYRPGKDIKGPLTVAAADTISNPGGKGNKSEGRLVVTGTSLLAANAYLGFQGNKDLVMNMINWLSAEESMISIRPKAHEHQTLDMNQRQMGRLLYLGVFGLPLAIILVGTGVWWRRRR
ncbi:MAG: GldG family protein [Acidobacteria bacterium]|nr:GldG family protein [Acidobacteriota bacterium]